MISTRNTAKQFRSGIKPSRLSRLSRQDLQIQPTIKFTIFFGTMMTFLIVLPAMNGCTFRTLSPPLPDRRIVGVHRHFDDVAELAVHLHGNFNLALDEQRRVELRPRRVGERGRGLAERGMQPRPKFFREVRRERREQLQKSFHHGQRLRLPRHRLVDENHHRGNRRVETHAVQIFGDFFDARVQRLELRGRGVQVGNGAVEQNQIQQFFALLAFAAVVSACSKAVSDFSSTNKRQTRPRKRYTPSTPLVFHGFTSCNGPMNIS